jgi:hypothetical protein
MRPRRQIRPGMSFRLRDLPRQRYTLGRISPVQNPILGTAPHLTLISQPLIILSKSSLNIQSTQIAIKPRWLYISFYFLKYNVPTAVEISPGSYL